MEFILILAGVFIISLIIIKLVSGSADFSLAGRIAMSVILIITALGHFFYAEGMAMMIPDFFPLKMELVYFTGILELSAAAGLLVPEFLRITSILLIIFFILILPANIHAALNNINFKTADNSGPGAGYLWFRIPLQIIFIFWTFFFGIYLNKVHKE